MAETLLKADAFDGWHQLWAKRAAWTFEEFRDAMIGEYLPPGIQNSRDTAFYRTGYDLTFPKLEVIQQFRRELLYCRHLCTDDASRIRILSMRLSPEILLHLSTSDFLTLRAFQRAMTLYDEQMRRSAAISAQLRDEKRQRIELSAAPVAPPPPAPVPSSRPLPPQQSQFQSGP